MTGRLLVCFALFSPATPAQSLEVLIDRDLDKLVEAYRHLHSHPELSYYEEQTSEYVASRLEDLGFEVTRNVGRYTSSSLTSYGLVAVLENGRGPAVMVRTDLDGLPVTEATGVSWASRVRTRNDQGDEVGVMHACGHDLHMTSFLGTARMLVKLRQHWKGTLVMIGQPAEERGAGARAMLAGGLYDRFPRPDYALALHTNADMEAGKIGWCPGYALANVDSVDITIRGRGGHGAYPHTTKDPVVIAAQVILGLQTIVSREVSPLESAVVTVGSIHGGTKHNIISDEVRLQLTVRTYKPEVRKRVLDSIRRITRGVAMAAGVPPDRAPSVSFQEDEYTPATYNDPELMARLVPVLQSRLGEQRVVRKEPVMGGEDFSRFGMEEPKVPIAMFWLGAVEPARVARSRQTGEPLPSLHSAGFIPRAETAIRTGVLAMTSAVLELMQ